MDHVEHKAVRSLAVASREPRATYAAIIAAVSAGDDAALDHLLVEDFVDHNPVPGQPAGRAGFAYWAASARTALAGLQGTIEDTLVRLSEALIAPQPGDRRAAGRSATPAGRAPERRRVRTARHTTSWRLPPVHQPQPLAPPAAPGRGRAITGAHPEESTPYTRSSEGPFAASRGERPSRSPSRGRLRCTTVDPERVTLGARLTMRTPASHPQVTERIAARARGRKQPTAPPRRRMSGGRGLRCVQVMDSVGSLTSRAGVRPATDGDDAWRSSTT